MVLAKNAWSVVWVFVALASCSKVDEQPPVSTQALRPAADAPAHLLVTLELSPTGLRVIAKQRVEQPLPRLRVPEPGRWHVAFRDAQNQLVQTYDMAPANELRAETMGPDGALSAHHGVLDSTVFVVRLPVTAGTLTLTADSTAQLRAAPVELGQVAVTP